MTDEAPLVFACPGCGSSALSRRANKHNDEPAGWHCYGCGSRFSTADKRERRREPGYSGLVARLLEADPDDAGGHE